MLDHPAGFRVFRGTDLFDRIGGQGIEDDDQLRPMFPHDLAGERLRQQLFFTEWLGGPGRYSEQAYAGLRHRHDGLPITTAIASRWLEHFRRAMAATVAAESDRATIFAEVRSLAMALVSEQSGPRPVAWCGIGARSVARARDLAGRGDAAGLGAALAEAPDLLLPSYIAAIMQAAAMAGRAGIVRMLLDRGAGADHPFNLPVSVTGRTFERVVFVTPLCAARMKRRAAVESLLLSAGAHEDVFTAAFLGDLSALERMLAADPGLAQAADPAVDVLDITPVEHAVAGGRTSALRLIVDHVARPWPGYVRALRGAAAQGSLAMTEMLLAGGADATRIGVGRWVLDPELAPLLASRGAKIDSSGSWMSASCTGNQGRKDDPEYVRALLSHGARATDRGAGGVTALHYAARAGFLRTIGVLIEHRADPGARDARGHTPLDWLDQAAPSVSRAAVRDLVAI